MTQLLAAIVANSIFLGVLAAACASALLYQLRAVPTACWGWLHKRFTVTLVIDNDEELFDRVSIYLSSSPYIARARWLRMVDMYDYGEQRWKWTPSFGLGWHLFRDQGAWILLHRGFDRDAKGVSPKRRETMTLRTFGQSQSAIRALMARAEAVYDGADTIRVYVWHKGAYILADHKPVRSMDTVFVPDAQKRRLSNDFSRFLASRSLYRERGTPWRRGYLLEGPPGTGKSTLAFVIACLGKRPVYMINLNTAGGDTGLMAAFNSADAGAVVVIEDVDSASITHVRVADAPTDVVAIKPEDAVTLAGLLNAVDGMAARENRILIMTSNHADRLDPALLRAGRIDCREVVGLIEAREARKMTAAFLGDEAGPWFDREVAPKLPMAPAELQGMLLKEGECGANVVDFSPKALTSERIAAVA